MCSIYANVSSNNYLDTFYLLKDGQENTLLTHTRGATLTLDNTHNSFTVYFSSSVFEVKPEKTVTFVFMAKASIKYAGNKVYIRV